MAPEPAQGPSFGTWVFSYALLSLLLVVHLGGGDFLAGRIGHGQMNRATLTVRRDNNAAAGNRLSAHFVG